jgi:hypothetical protein
MTEDSPPELKKDKHYTFRPFRVPKYKVEFERANKLSDVPGYVWYSPAVLYIWGRYSEVNLSDLVQQHDIQIFWYRFDKPVFKGFTVNGDSAWNYVLWAAREDQWQKICETILETVQFDIPKQQLYQYALQSLTVYDPLNVDTNRVVLHSTPKISIHTFAALSNVGQVAFDTRKSDVRIQPHVVNFKPDKLHVDAANRLFSQSGLTQDDAFERYKQIMLDAQDASFHQKWKASNT